MFTHYLRVKKAVRAAIILLLLGGLLVTPASTTLAYNLFNVSWQQNSVGLWIGENIPEADWQQLIQQAADTWNSVHSKVRIVRVTDQAQGKIRITRNYSTFCPGTDVAACVYDPPNLDAVSGYLDHCYISLNTDQVGTQGEVNLVSVYSVTLHELGHCLGIKHSNDASAIMYPIINPGIRKDIGDDDRNGLWARYPLGGAWVLPAGGGNYGASIHLEAQASGTSDNPVNFVDFTAFYGNAWHSVCTRYNPLHDNVYGCDWDFSGVPAGTVKLSFDVYGPTYWNIHYQPGGERIIQYAPGTGGGGGSSGGGTGTSSCTNSPFLNGPVDGSVVARAVSFSWNPPSTCAPDGYTLRINTSSNPDTQPFIVDTGVGTSSYNYTFANDGTYYWHVRACKTCSPYVAGPWNTARIIVDAGAGNGAQVCANTGYGTPCQEYHYTGNDASCLDLGSLRASNKSVRFIGSYAGNYDAIFYHDTGCGSYMARYSQNTPDIGSSMYNQFSSMRLERHKQPGSLQIGDYLTLSPTSMQVGQVVTAKFSVRNVGESALTVQSLGAAVRYGTSWDAPQYDFPGVANITLQPGESYFYSQQRSFTSPGGYFSQPVAQINNTWASVAGSNQVNFTASNPPAPTQADQQSTTIYDESLASGWQNWSWGSSVNLADTGRPYSGGKAIYWQPNTAYAGLFLHNDTPFNLSGYATLTFAMKGTWSGQTYAVMLYDANGNSTGSLVPLAQLGGDPPTDHFRQYVIPLSVFGAVNTQITGFHIQDLTGSSTPAAAYVDRIMMGGNNGDPWVNLPASKLYAYNDSLTSGWQSWSWDSTINWTSGPSYTGANSITWTPTAGWAGLDIHNPTGVSTSSYATVHFALKATQPGEQFAIFLAGSNNTGIKTAIPLTDYGGNPVTGYWKRYDIPLADLGGNGVTITGIVIQSNLGTAQPNVYVDEVVLY